MKSIDREENVLTLLIQRELKRSKIWVYTSRHRREPFHNVIEIDINQQWVYTKFMGITTISKFKQKNTLYFGSVARTREKKTNIAAVIVQKRKEQRREQKYTKFSGCKEPRKIMHENEKLISDKLPFGLEEEKPQTNSTQLDEGFVKKEGRRS
jgi:hypothetical protein